MNKGQIKKMVPIMIWIFSSVLAVALLMLVSSPYAITYDSAYQYALTGKSFARIFELLPADYSPPLYAVLLKFINILGGANLSHYRLLNGVFLSGMLCFCIFPVRKTFGEMTAWISTLMIACSMVNFRIFSEIRPTFLATFFAFGMFIYAYRSFWIEKKKDYILFTIFAILCMYTHNIALLASFGVYLVCILGSVIFRQFKKMLAFVASGIISLIMFIPWLFVLINQMKNVSNQFWEGESFTVSYVRDVLIDSIIYYPTKAVDGQYEIILPSIFNLLLLGGVLIILLMYFKVNTKGNIVSFIEELKSGWKQCRIRLLKYLFLWMELCVPLLVFAIVNETFHHLLTQRYLFIFSGIMILLMTLPIAKAQNKVLCIVFGMAVVLNYGHAYLFMWNSAKNIEGKEMVEEIRKAHPDGDISFLHQHEWSLGIMMYYFPDAKHYIYDDTWTVLTDLSVFPTEVISIGKAENISHYTDDFYVFAPKIRDQEFMKFEDLGDNAVLENKYTYHLNIGHPSEVFCEKIEFEEVRIIND